MSESRRDSISALIRELFAQYGRDPDDVALIRKCTSLFSVYSGSLARKIGCVYFWDSEGT